MERIQMIAGQNGNRWAFLTLGPLGHPRHPYRPLRGMVLAVPSQLTIENRDAFRRELLAWIDDAIAHGRTAVALDLSGTQDLDVSGIALLVAVQQRASLNNVHITLRHPNERVRQMLTLSRMATLFTIES
jgi:anti-anti-sigma factor